MPISGEELARAANRPGLSADVDRGEPLVTGGEAVLRVLDTETGAVLFELLGHRGGSWHYEVIPGTSLLASGGLADGQTLVFDVTDVGFERGRDMVARFRRRHRCSLYARWRARGRDGMEFLPERVA